jgi:hypothetical protein
MRRENPIPEDEEGEGERGGEGVQYVQSAVLRASEDCSPDGVQDNNFEFMSSISKVMTSCEVS